MTTREERLEKLGEELERLMDEPESTHEQLKFPPLPPPPTDPDDVRAVFIPKDPTKK